MTDHTITRRTALAGAAALPVLPAIGQAGATPNATDAAWADYLAAKAEFEAIERAADAWEAAMPTHLRMPGPLPYQYKDPGAFDAARDSWHRERAAHGENPHTADDGPLEEAAHRMNAAQLAVIQTPAATLVDLERKIGEMAAIAEHSDLEREDWARLHADARAMLGRAA